MKAAELRRRDRIALHAELSSLLKAQAGLRIQLATQQLHNTSQLKKIRCEIARVRTILAENLLKNRSERGSGGEGPGLAHSAGTGVYIDVHEDSCYLPTPPHARAVGL